MGPALNQTWNYSVDGEIYSKKKKKNKNKTLNEKGSIGTS